MLELIDLPSEKDELFPHEVPILLNYRVTKKQLQWKIDLLRAATENQEDTHHADA